MRYRLLLAGSAALLLAAGAQAQLRLPHLVQQPGQRGPAPVGAVQLQGIDAARADFAAQTGSATIYFGIGSSGLGAPAIATLAAQARWLLRHPEIVVQVEGFGDPSDTRDHALAIGADRAEAVRNYLMLLGVPSGQLTTVSFGKERVGPGRAQTVLVR